MADFEVNKKKIKARNETDAIIDAYDENGQLILHVEEDEIE